MSNMMKKRAVSASFQKVLFNIILMFNIITKVASWFRRKHGTKTEKHRARGSYKKEKGKRVDFK